MKAKKTIKSKTNKTGKREKKLGPVTRWFSDKSKWTKGMFFKDKKGNACLMSEAASCCLSGAIWKFYPHNKVDIVETKVAKEISLNNQEANIAIWNDAEKRKFSDVQKLVRKLNI